MEISRSIVIVEGGCSRGCLCVRLEHRKTLERPTEHQRHTIWRIEVAVGPGMVPVIPEKVMRIRMGQAEPIPWRLLRPLRESLVSEHRTYEIVAFGQDERALLL